MSKVVGSRGSVRFSDPPFDAGLCSRGRDHSWSRDPSRLLGLLRACALSVKIDGRADEDSEGRRVVSAVRNSAVGASRTSGKQSRSSAVGSCSAILGLSSPEDWACSPYCTIMIG